MKVNTDGCLLGSWAHHNNPKRILDIGAGSGVIALMLAQRFEKAEVTAVEIEDECAKQCTSNFEKSPFQDRLTCINVDINQFESSLSFDLIVSNPPYFENATPAKGNARLHARHHKKLTLLDLFKNVNRLLSETGNFCLILPFERQEEAVNIAEQFDLYPNEIVALRPLPEKPIHRSMMLFSRYNTSISKTEVSIEIERSQYSPIVTDWLKPFYLNL